MKRIIGEVFDYLKIRKHRENLGILTNHVSTILDPIPLGEMGYSVKHYAEHIKLCVPPEISCRGENAIIAYLNFNCNSSDLRDVCERAAKNMKLQREEIKTMLHKVGIQKDDQWKENIRHIADLFGAMPQSAMQPTISAIGILAMQKKRKHGKDPKKLFSVVAEEWKKWLDREI